MASLTLLEAAKLSQNRLQKGAFLAITTVSEAFLMLEMEPTGGESLVYNREQTLADAEFVSDGHTSLTESGTTFNKVTVPVRRIASNLDVDNFVEEQMSETNSQRAVQVEKKLKACGRKIADKMFNGVHYASYSLSPQPASWGGPGIDALVAGPGQDTSRHGPGAIKYTHAGTLWQYRAPGDTDFGTAVAIAADSTGVVLKSQNESRYIVIDVDVSDAAANGHYQVLFTTTSNEPDGLIKLISTGQVIAPSLADGDDYSFDILDQLLYEKVKVKDKLAYVMNAKLARKHRALVRALGGTDPEHVSLPNFTGKVMAYNGVPILIDDNIPSTETVGTTTTCSSIMLASFAAAEGFFAGCGGGAQDVQADPRKKRVLGLKIRDVGELEDKDAQRTRITWYGAFGLRSDLAAARARGIKTV